MSCAINGCGWPSDPCPFHPVPPAMRKTGAELRDEALDQVERGTPTDWVNQAEAIVASLAHTGRPFTPDDVWAAGLARPREPRALGPVMMRAVRSGLIEPTGEWVNSKQSSQHATPVRVWRGTQKATAR